ncbi:galactokinase [bacterium]|nr:galactokinase [bacterium]
MTSIASLADLYASDMQPEQMARYQTLANKLIERTGVREGVRFISTPGRTELGGNHTDHNQGKVLCAAVQQDMVAAVQARDDNHVRFESVGFGEMIEMSLDDLTAQPGESGTTQALIRGVAEGLVQRDAKVGGFDAVVDSHVPVGSGLSSSASVEVLLGGILNALYNKSTLDPVALAQVGQYAENVHFDKPCGLMDQLGCAVGGIISIDFKETSSPVIRRVNVDFSATPYTLAVVDTGGSHDDLTDAYASIPNEMKAVAKLFGKDVLREVDQEVIPEKIAEIREKLGDRSLLRMLHFYRENRRVEAMMRALERLDFDAYLDQVASSGASSTGALQNIIPPGEDGRDQPTAVALGYANAFFEQRGRGVGRIHGGGFAGTIQVFVHRDDYDEFRSLMESIFNRDCVSELIVRSIGVTEVHLPA